MKRQFPDTTCDKVKIVDVDSLQVFRYDERKTMWIIRETETKKLKKWNQCNRSR